MTSPHSSLTWSTIGAPCEEAPQERSRFDTAIYVIYTIARVPSIRREFPDIIVRAARPFLPGGVATTVAALGFVFQNLPASLFEGGE